jgi:hypothetical protein
MHSSHGTGVGTPNLLLAGTLAGQSHETRGTVLSVRASYQITVTNML